ncbi:hypothetical protein [Geomicrobium sp. JCM 19055]|uniref:hypothetical protein n=1 Tax=Geomicrobium sp. JCM 19055 TaxID=1460649 RepID=UPI00045ED02C|nr:hypothetical protein [Geomicrobium sp. JCM 19055]GAJ99581.1 hypothetical protein JCM19055_2590 [Geomicrobium sp. JCM 19055]
MKKMFVVLGVAVAMIIFLLIQNSHLKNESQSFEEKLTDVVDSNETLHIESGENAKQFINHYFTYQKKPNREEVEPYATSQTLDQLQFEESEGIEEEYDDDLESVQSDVSNLHIYYGQSIDDRQEVVAMFENEIEVNGISSSAISIMQLDMVQNEGVWKVDNFTFHQY